MRSTILNIVILGTLVSCGAAKNPKSRNGNGDPNLKPKTPNVTGELLQATMRSHIFRNRESEQYTYSSLAKKIETNELPKTHRLIPDMDQDIEANIIKPTKLLSPEKSCGNENDAKINIATRHNNCKEVQVDLNTVTWAGRKNGISGEGDWRLISNSAYIEDTKQYNKQVWQDMTTGLLWSEVIYKISWSEASGIDSFADTRPCLAKSDSPKHELGRIHPSIVSWRLPNRNEFLQADLDGSRFVLPNTLPDSEDNLVWTASYAEDNMAWAINVSTGQLVKKSIDDELAVRCIGVKIPVKQ